MDTNSLGEMNNQDANGLSTEQNYMESTPSAPAEKSYPASKMQEIVRHATRNIADKAKKEAWEEAERHFSTEKQPTLNEDSIRGVISDEFNKQINAHSEKQLKDWQEREGNRIATELFGKINADKDKYPDFSSLVNEVPLSTIPGIAQLALNFDNTTGVLHEMLSNPLKAMMLEQFAKTNPKAAEKELRKIAESIKLNEQAKNAKLPNEPLSQLKTSTAGVDNGSPTTVSDFRQWVLNRQKGKK